MLYNVDEMSLSIYKHVRKPFVYVVIVAFVLAILGGALLLARQVYSPQTHSVVIQKKTASKPLATLKAVIKTTPTVKPDYTLPPIQDGLAPVLTTIPTKQPVVFLGIDDGGFKDPSELQVMKDNNIKATLFLSNAFISDNPDFFKQFVTAGQALIEDHTLHHYIDLPSRSLAVQEAEICGEADYMQQEYGRRPVLFRPPGGSYNTTTQRAAATCGMKAVINWIAKANGGAMQYQIGSVLRPGDIVLMHFRPVFLQDMQAFIVAEKAAGLHTELLEDWLDPH
jgi:peptidoglycan/xylan/chitin deacetylase (PgdA/CDA1 family)